MDSGRYTINVKHYYPDPTQQRRSQVFDKLLSDARRQYGKDAEVNYSHEEGPTASHKNATGIYALMGALDFGTHHSFQSKDKFWGGDPVKTIKGALQATRPRYPTSGGTPARRGSSVCSTGNGAEGMRTPARTPRNATRDGWELPSCDELDVFGAHTPPTGRKRRRLDPVDPIAFNVKENLETATSSILNLGLPSVTDLQQDVGERRKERSEHNEVVEKKKKELETCQDKRASLARIHEECEKACTELEIKLNDDERRVSKWLSEFPLDLNFAIDTERYKTPGEDRWKPERINLMEAQNRKRKANESLDSANQDFSYLERVVGVVLEEGRVIEEGVKMAYMHKEFVAMKERHLEDQRAFLLRFEGDDWEKKLDARGGKM
ncbi:hypothetical protein FMEXI_1507 [Fusarium mexicanum]|uniref:Uncharacterized protein n=1 Tax=Fusarium mexicanum TaxID=751941 RepID=A0A8H5N6H2_9HYPO|nr:hypothetical protein FMEXI_1507 [Fusarium mexicanum]